MDRNRTYRNRRRALKALHIAGLFVIMAIICIPGLWIVLNSFRPTVEIMAKPPVWTPSFTLEHYRAMFGGAGEGGVPVFSYFRNSLIVSVVSTFVAILIGGSINGGIKLQVATGVPSTLVDAIQAIVLMFYLAAAVLARYKFRIGSNG